jgi:hypothetical protein
MADQSKRRQFEYEGTDAPNLLKLVNQLNELDAQGWELVGSPIAIEKHFFALLRRPHPEREKPKGGLMWKTSQ